MSIVSNSPVSVKKKKFLDKGKLGQPVSPRMKKEVLQFLGTPQRPRQEMSMQQSNSARSTFAKSNEVQRSTEKALAQAASRRESFVGAEAQKEARQKVVEVVAPPPPMNQIQAKMEYQRAHQEAVEIYNAKVKDFPELAGVRKKVVEDKDKRLARKSTVKGDSLKMSEGVLKETITDDRGREIVFKKPDGNRLSRVCPAFKDGMSVSFQPTKIKLKKRAKKAEASPDAAGAETAPKDDGLTPARLPG